jgi:exonuclease III
MIFLSLNIRGVGGTLKSTSFRRLLSRTSPDIIFLQETLVDGQKVRTFLNKFHPNWHTCSVNSLGTSGGLAVSWDPTKFDLISLSVLWWHPTDRYQPVEQPTDQLSQYLWSMH